MNVHCEVTKERIRVYKTCLVLRAVWVDDVRHFTCCMTHGEQLIWITHLMWIEVYATRDYYIRLRATAHRSYQSPVSDWRKTVPWHLRRARKVNASINRAGHVEHHETEHSKYQKKNYKRQLLLFKKKDLDLLSQSDTREVQYVSFIHLHTHTQNCSHRRWIQ